jgi:hypothetical protein
MEKKMKKRIVLIMVILLTAMAIPSLAKSRFGVRADAGFGYFPMSDWVNWTESLREVRKWDPSFTGNAGIVYCIGKNHHLIIETGIMKTSATTSGIIYYTSAYGDTIGIEVFFDEMSFQTIPLGLCYEMHFPFSSSGYSFLTGANVSYLFTNTYAKQREIYSDLIPLQEYEDKSNANGYCIGLYLGLNAPLTSNLSMFTKLKGQYADATFSWGSDRGAKIEFTGVCLNTGLQWLF